jgi:Arc/MetJ-type ribon-helix-helix transcriptional regulator
MATNLLNQSYQPGMLTGMNTTQIAVRLPTDLLAEVDRIVDADVAASRADAVRRALDSWVRAVNRRRIGKEIVDGYDRVPSGRPDDWGDLDAALDWGTAAVIFDLERQEREAGIEPW